ncbi:hypothetical protein [Natrarchaeobius oligotrophus]|uniref:Histidinol-phosphatase n=1 Tax=Natrarchaeobius chitinivorans TaxID=1679083 RepID=A0A3N6N4F4_NATCH|nr:hypothetical protein [Natrarchaeobius chitinivorans]RQH02637.1 hypothetical protein EA472_04900 [Natrarchaeobius chitinivorans]
MDFTHPYEEVDWSKVEHHLAQFHVHEPRNKLSADTARHEPDVAAEGVPIDHIGKNNLSEASSPGVLIQKYRNAGYTVFSLTEHEYQVDGNKYKHVPYDECDADLDKMSWPWSKWGVDADKLEMVALQGAEIRGDVHGVDNLHDIVSLDNDLGHGRDRPIEEVVADVEERGGIMYLAHPSKYTDTENWEIYCPVLESCDALLGLEIFNGDDRAPSRELWDRLLTHFGKERPLWASGGDDYHARARERYDKRFNRSRTVVLVSELSKRNVTEALRNGRSYVQYNGDAQAPFIESIESSSNSVTISAPDANEITWIAEGEEVATGETVVSDALDDPAYVRAELGGRGGSITATNPFYLE